MKHPLRHLGAAIIGFSLLLSAAGAEASDSFFFRWGTAGIQSNGTTAAADCSLPWGGSLLDGESSTAYQADQVAFGNTCASEIRTCADGVLSGSFAHQTCAADPASNCTSPWGAPVGHGSDVTAFQTASVPFGNSCSSEQRNCFNGSLSGSYQFSSCAPLSAANCTAPWGATVLHGASTAAYQTASVPFGSTCTSEVRSCSNGALSGGFANQACTVQAAASCLPQSVSWGSNCSASISGAAHGAPLTVSNTAGGFTGSGDFSCNNGTWQNTGGTCQAQLPTCDLTLGYTVDPVWKAITDPNTNQNMTVAQCVAWCVAHGAQPGDICWGLDPTKTGVLAGCALHAPATPTWVQPGNRWIGNPYAGSCHY